MRARLRRLPLADDLRVALPGWIAGRALVLAGWVGAWVWSELQRGGARAPAADHGLFAWDGVFYRGVAEHGYAGEATEALRFFPLYPLVSRVLGVVLTDGVALLVVSNAAALVAAALIHRIALVETGDRRVAARAAWLTALVPPSFVLSWAYAEALFVVLAAGAFLLLRQRRWWGAAAAGFAAGLCRPTGILLTLAATVEVFGARRRWSAADGASRVAAALAPVLGAAAYLWWVEGETGDWQLPLRLQDELRGGFANPVVRIGEGIADLGRLEVDGLHVPFVLALAVLAVAVCRRLPASFAAYTVAVVAVGISAGNLNSVERYGLNAFPVVLALAAFARGPRSWRITQVTCGAGLAGLAMLAWLGEYVP